MADKDPWVAHLFDEAQQAASAALRQKCREVAALVEEAIPASRERSLVLTKLEEAMFWGNAAIARNGVNGASA